MDAIEEMRRKALATLKVWTYNNIAIFKNPIHFNLSIEIFNNRECGWPETCVSY